MYAGERGKQTGKICGTGNNCNDDVVRTTTWVGRIGLMYPSDYAYASANAGCKNDIVGSDSTCNVSNWLQQSSDTYFTISPNANSAAANLVWIVDSSLRAYMIYTDVSYKVRPALYLSSLVEIIGGDGSEGNAYRLSIQEK